MPCWRGLPGSPRARAKSRNSPASSRERPKAGCWKAPLHRRRRASRGVWALAWCATRTGTSTARLAHHADGARDAGEVLRFAPLAASQAATVGAHREAASHYELALRYADDIPPDGRARLQDRLSYECYLTGQIERATEARRQALSIWRVQGERVKVGSALRWLSRLSWY